MAATMGKDDLHYISIVSNFLQSLVEAGLITSVECYQSTREVINNDRIHTSIKALIDDVQSIVHLHRTSITSGDINTFASLAIQNNVLDNAASTSLFAWPPSGGFSFGGNTDLNNQNGTTTGSFSFNFSSATQPASNFEFSDRGSVFTNFSKDINKAVNSFTFECGNAGSAGTSSVVVDRTKSYLPLPKLFAGDPPNDTSLPYEVGSTFNHFTVHSALYQNVNLYDVAQWIAKCTNKHFHWCYADLSDEDVYVIVDALKASKTWRTVALSVNSFGDNATAKLCELLTHEYNLQALILVQNRGITSTGVAYIASALAANCTLTKLVLSENNLSEESLITIATSLTTNKTLIHLDVSGGRIRKQNVVVAFNNSLSTNSTLCYLFLFNAEERDESIKSCNAKLVVFL
jgi:hypothetical protein